jgi:hypothetical protein
MIQTKNFLQIIEKIITIRITKNQFQVLVLLFTYGKGKQVFK